MAQLSDVLVKLVGDMRDLQAKIDPSLMHQSFGISKHSEYFMLKFPDGKIFAQVNKLACQGLDKMQEVPSVEIVAFVETNRLQHVFSRAKTPSEAALKVEVNLYGSTDDAKIVGEKLSAAKMFLQDPERGAENMEYCNPHVAQFPGIEEPAPMLADKVSSHSVPKSSKAVGGERENLDQTVSAIYQSLVRFRNLERMQAGDMIRTPLLPYAYHIRRAWQQATASEAENQLLANDHDCRHQETALYFMLQRELGPIPPEFRLWADECNVVTRL